MSVLFACSEVEGFYTPAGTGGNTVSWTTSNPGVWYDSTHTRGALFLEGLGRLEVVDQPISGALNEVEMWIHFKWAWQAGVPGRADNWILLLEESNTDNLFLLDANNSGNATLGLYYWVGAAWVLVGSTFNFLENKLYEIDVHVTINNTVGIAEWYVDREKIAGASNLDTDPTGGATIARVAFGALRQGAGLGGEEGFFSEIIITDSENTIGWHLATLEADGNGTHTAWSGDFTDIDEAGLQDDTDFVSSSLNNDVESFTAADMPTLGTDDEIKGVSVCARPRNNTGTPANVQLHVRSNASDNYSANMPTIDVGYNPTAEFWATDPSTAAAWLEADVNAVEFGVRAIT